MKDFITRVCYQGKKMAVNKMNSWGYGKPKMATWFFEAPCQTPFFSVFIHSFMPHIAFKLDLDLDEGTYELPLLKGDSLHYCQGLIKSLPENAKWVTASFPRKQPEDKRLRIINYHLEILFTGKDIK